MSAPQSGFTPYLYPPDRFSGRRIFTGISVDPPGSQDIDDGFALKELEDGGYRVDISIADASYGVPRHSEMDANARRKKRTFYGVDRIWPMLPRGLCFNSLSLLEHVERPAVTISIFLDRNLEITGTEFTRSVFYNNRQATYDEIDNDYNSGNSRIITLCDFAARYHQKRRGLNIAGLQENAPVDEEGRRLEMPESWHRAHILVMEMMLMENTAVARYCKEKDIPILYRNYSRTLSLEDAADQASLAPHSDKAVYAPQPLGHAALGVEAYTHFTSPLRRYPDIIVHRQLLAALNNEPLPYDHTHLGDLAAHLSPVLTRAFVSCASAEQRDSHGVSNIILGMLLNSETPAEHFSTLPAAHVKYAVRIARKNEISHKGLSETLSRMLEQPNFPEPLMYEILRPDLPRPSDLEELQQKIFQLAKTRHALLANMGEVVSARHKSLPPVWKETFTGGKITAIPVFTIQGQALSPPEVYPWSDRSYARQRGTAAFWYAFSQNKTVPAGNTVVLPTIESAATNEAKTCTVILHKAANNLGFEIRQKYTQGKNNKQVCHMRVLNFQGKSEHKFEATGQSIREAHENASRSALISLGLDDKLGLTLPAEPKVPVLEKHPVNLVNEFCTAHGWQRPVFHITPVPQPPGSTYSVLYDCTTDLADSEGTPVAHIECTDTNTLNARKLAAFQLWQALAPYREAQP